MRSRTFKSLQESGSMDCIFSRVARSRWTAEALKREMENPGALRDVMNDEDRMYEGEMLYCDSISWTEYKFIIDRGENISKSVLA